MVHLIMESSILARQMHNYVRVNSKEVTIHATEGFLYIYEMTAGGGLRVKLSKPRVYAKLLALKNSLTVKDEVVIATDHDPAGEVIALELLDLFPMALRYKNRVDDMLFYKEIAASNVLSHSSTDCFAPKLAEKYMIEKFTDNPVRKEKMKVMQSILAHDNENDLVLPEKYQDYIEGL